MHSKNRTIFIVIFLSIFVYLLSNNNFLNVILSKKNHIKESLISSQKWFDAFQEGADIMNYIYYPETNSFDDERNMVRELGSFWGYTRLYAMNKNEESLNKINNIRNNIEKYLKDDQIKQNKIAYLEHDDVAEINTQAFYILALAELSKAGVDLNDKELSNLKRIINGIYLMKANEGGLWYIYYLPEEHNKISPYGTSEILFSLIYYYKYIEKDEKVLEFAKTVFDEYYLIAKNYNFSDEEARSFYSWILYFLVELDEIDKERYHYIEDLINKALDYRKDNPECRNRGCLMFPKTTSEAAFLEGNIYSFNLLSQHEYERIEELKNYINLAIEDVLSMQIKSVKDYKVKTDKIFTGDEKIIVGGYCSGTNDANYFCQTLRNDFTQHSSSAVLNYYNTFY